MSWNHSVDQIRWKRQLAGPCSFASRPLTTRHARTEQHPQITSAHDLNLISAPKIEASAHAFAIIMLAPGCLAGRGQGRLARARIARD